LYIISEVLITEEFYSRLTKL